MKNRFKKSPGHAVAAILLAMFVAMSLSYAQTFLAAYRAGELFRLPRREAVPSSWPSNITMSRL